MITWLLQKLRATNIPLTVQAQAVLCKSVDLTFTNEGVYEEVKSESYQCS